MLIPICPLFHCFILTTNSQSSYFYFWQLSYSGSCQFVEKIQFMLGFFSWIKRNGFEVIKNDVTEKSRSRSSGRKMAKGDFPEERAGTDAENYWPADTGTQLLSGLLSQNKERGPKAASRLTPSCLWDVSTNFWGFLGESCTTSLNRHLQPLCSAKRNWWNTSISGIRKCLT